MELKVRTKEAITNPEQIAKIFQAIQKAENEIDGKEKVLGSGLNTKNFILYVEPCRWGRSTLPWYMQGRFSVLRSRKAACPGSFWSHIDPSGDPGPSEDDLALTRRLYDAGKILGIDLHDQIIIGDGPNYTSLKEGGTL